ncbi:Bye1p [Sugiyamaella lignohabitans]|uniref:Transcription factor BYE1 n=1 Tax=Sugiyamaella lignohabitans TaxID=796027 RepID=A0A167DPX4_9ASCO|nr:Bye1p [Sugiyamaella lignohabitans]ANB13151.1 Bye1p [Sugiyamaella lignohabitans]
MSEPGKFSSLHGRDVELVPVERRAPIYHRNAAKKAISNIAKADETGGGGGPRRSSRATKGKNSRLEERDKLEEEAKKIKAEKEKKRVEKEEKKKLEDEKKKDSKSQATATATANKVNNSDSSEAIPKKKRGRKKKDSERETDENDGEVNCICGATSVDDDDDRVMAECEKCLKWQHVVCMFGFEDERVVPEKYQCHVCDPSSYEELLNKPKQEEEEKSEENSEKQEPIKAESKEIRKRKSGSLGATDNDRETEIKQEKSKKRKTSLTDTTGPIIAQVDESTKVASVLEPKNGSFNESPNKQTSSSEDATNTAVSEPVSSAVDATPSPTSGNTDQATRPSITTDKNKDSSSFVDLGTKKIADLQDKVRRSVATALCGIFKNNILPEAVKKGVIDSSSNIDGLAEKFSVEIEESLYEHLAMKPSGSSKPKDVGPKYRDKFRTLSFNLKDDKNPEFRLRIATGQLTAEQLVTLTNEEMLNPELQKLAESVRKESIRESVLKVDTAPRLRKTHKGEELVGGDEALDLQQVKEDAYERDDDKGNANNREMLLNAETFRSERSQSVERDYDSGGNMDVVSYSPPGSPENEEYDIDDDDFNLSNIEEQGKEKEKQMEKPNDQADHLASSNNNNINSDITGPPLIWTGHVTMPGVAQFPGSATHIAGGGNFDPTSNWNQVFNLDAPIVIDGRLDDTKAIPYLRNVRHSKDIVAFVLKSDEISNPGQPNAGDELFDYFHSRHKYGVIKHRHKIVKDAYIVTVGANDEIPDYLTLSGEQLGYLRHLQATTGNVILGVFVVQPFKAGVRQSTTPPAVTAVSTSTPPATSAPLSTSEFSLLQGILAGNNGSASQSTSGLPSNPQSLLDLLQQTTGSNSKSNV